MKRKAQQEAKALRAVANNLKPRPALVKRLRRQGRHVAVDLMPPPLVELLDEGRINAGI